MNIWANVDAIPAPLREVLCEVSLRRKVGVVMLSHKSLGMATPALVRTLVLPEATIEALHARILAQCAWRDLVVTSDLDLIFAVIDRGASVLTTYGKILEGTTLADHFGQRPSVENDGPLAALPRKVRAPFGAAQRENFAQALDQWLTRRFGE